MVKLIIIIPQKAGQIPEIDKFGINIANKAKMETLMTIVKSPRVIKIKGGRKNFNIGLMQEFNNPKISPAIKSCHQEPIKLTPGSR